MDEDAIVGGFVLLSKPFNPNDHPSLYLGWHIVADIPEIAPANGDDDASCPTLSDEGHAGRAWPCLVVSGGHIELEQRHWIDRGEFA